MEIQRIQKDIDMNSLPEEVIANILSFLPEKKLEWPSMVCRKWFYASRHPKNGRTLRMEYDTELLEKLIEDFRNSSTIPFNALELSRGCNVVVDLKPFYAFGARQVYFKRLQLVECNLMPHQLSRFLRMFKNLRHLTFKCACTSILEIEFHYMVYVRSFTLEILELDCVFLREGLTDVLPKAYPNLKKIILHFGGIFYAHNCLVEKLFVIWGPIIQKIALQNPELTIDIYFHLDDDQLDFWMRKRLFDYVQIKWNCKNIIIKRISMEKFQILDEKLKIHKKFWKTHNQIEDLSIVDSEPELSDGIPNCLSIPVWSNLSVIHIDNVSLENIMDYFAPCQKLKKLTICHQASKTISLCSRADFILFHLESFDLNTNVHVEAYSFKKALKCVPNLKELNYIHCDTLDDKVASQKTYLTLAYVDTNLWGINELPLEKLQLSIFDLTSESLSPYFNISTLTHIDFYCKTLYGNGLDIVYKNCPRLEHVELSYCYNINDTCMINLCRGLKYLKKLVLAKDKKRPEALVETIIEHNKFIQRVEMSVLEITKPDVSNYIDSTEIFTFVWITS